MNRIFLALLLPAAPACTDPAPAPTMLCQMQGEVDDTPVIGWLMLDYAGQGWRLDTSLFSAVGSLSGPSPWAARGNGQAAVFLDGNNARFDGWLEDHVILMEGTCVP